MIAGVNAWLDFPLPVELHQLGQSAPDELLIRQEAQVESTDALVGLHQLQCSEGQLVVPGLCQSKQILLLACHTISCTCDHEKTEKTSKTTLYKNL